jgi:hypothetical protein
MTCFYGRGTGGDKYTAATFVSNLIRYKQEYYNLTVTSSWCSNRRGGDRENVQAFFTGQGYEPVKQLSGGHQLSA